MASPSPREPALATTKRKFDTLLDRLTASASTTSLASTLHESNASTTSLSQPTTPEPASKRSRLSDVSMEGRRTVSGSERIRALQNQLFTPRKEASMRAPGLRVVGGSNTAVKASTPRKPPNYQPYSQEQFLGRLKTFADVKKWTNKPDAIGEVEWAKRGWVCVTWNTVACKGGCEQRVVVQLRPRRRDVNGKEIEMSEDLTEDVPEGLVERFKELITNGHAEECLWRKRGCQNDIYHIAIPDRARSSTELLTRYRSFKSVASELPAAENVIYPDPRIEEVLRRTPSTVFNPPGSDSTEQLPESPAEIVSFLFALFGWTGVCESNIKMVVCNHCFQRIGLWLYEESRLKEMSKKLEVPVESLRLNLLESHREHCPWKNAEAQHNPPDGPIANMAGWQTLEFMLMGRRKVVERKNIESVDLGSEYTYPLGSPESGPRGGDKEEEESVESKWKRFKAKLRRTASMKSLKSAKSIKSSKSGKSGKSAGNKDKENTEVP